jgi:hypothetical protein
MAAAPTRTGTSTTGKRFVTDPQCPGHRYWLRGAEAPGSDLVDFTDVAGTTYALFIEVRTGCAYAVAL